MMWYVCTTVVWDVDNGGGYACVRVESTSTWKLHSHYFRCNVKLFLKSKVYLEKKKNFFFKEIKESVIV